MSSADLVVGWACSTVVALALGILLGTWLCNRVVARALKAGCQQNLVGSHEYRRYEDREVQENRQRLADTLSGGAGSGGDRHTDDDREDAKKITGLDDLKPGSWL